VNEAGPIRVVVGEDETLVREGIVRILERAGLEVVGVAADAEDLVRKAGAHHPDLAITDIEMPREMTDDGLLAAQRIRAAHPEVGVIVLSEYLEGLYAIELVGDRAEGVGCLLKDRVGDPALFIDAVRRVAVEVRRLTPTSCSGWLGALASPGCSTR
jgi:DNA-binding NarL/FixJ family response regulator